MPNTISARSLKCTVVVQAEEIMAIACPDGGPSRTKLTIRLPDRTVTVDLASKSIRKAQSLISASEPGGVACIVQGKLVAGDIIVEAGLTAQVKAAPKPEPVAA